MEEGAADSGCGIRGWFVTAFSISVAARPERGEHRCATVKTDCAKIKKGKNTHGVMSGPFGVKCY